ncbi:hypothetical protein L7F22_013543 [Adiantum nelumboides]|nr:hypothetical protein [Adiantum nelumboides]
MVCQLSNPEDYLWQGFMDDGSMPYDEQMADELDFNLANAFPEPDSISYSEPEVINEDDEVRRLNPVKMETDDVKVEEPSTFASSSSTSLKGVSKIEDMTIIDIDGLNQEQVWKVLKLIYNSVHYGVRYKELTQQEAVIMIIAGFQAVEKKCSCKVKDRRNKYGKKYKYESEEDETSDSTSFESPTEAVSTFSNDTSSVVFNMVRKPYAFSKKAKIAYRMIVRIINTCLPSIYNAGYLCNDQSQGKGLNIVMKVDPTSQGSLPDLVQWQQVDFPTEWKLDISKTLLNEAQQPMKMSIKRLGLTDQNKLLKKSKSCKDLGLLMQRPQYREISESVSSNRPSSSRRQAKDLTLCLHPKTYKDTEGLYCCKLCNKLIASDYLQNGVTMLTKEQVAGNELKYSEPYILPPTNAKLQPMESASNWHINALKEIAKLQYSIISRIDAMVKAKQSATPSTSAAPPSTAS